MAQAQTAQKAANDSIRVEIYDQGYTLRGTDPDYIVKLVHFPEALQVLEFAHGKVSLVAVRAFQGGPLVGHQLKDIRITKVVECL